MHPEALNKQGKNLFPFPLLLKLLTFKGIKILNIKEIATSKAYTIGRRGSYKDYVDLYYIIKEERFSLIKIINLAEKKYQDDFNGRLFLEQLLYLDDVEDINIVFLKKKKINKKILVDFFQQEIKKIKL